MIGALGPEDAAAAAALSASFGWPHRMADWEAFLALGHGVGWREGEELGGTAMWFPLDDTHASIGLVQVAATLQGRGLGRRLMRAVMEAAAPRGLMLHATAEGAALYASLGFRAGEDVEQWQGTFTGIGVGEVPVRRGGAADRPAIERLDRAATGLARCAVLAAWLAGSEWAMAGTDAAPAGYAVRRRFGRGTLIGPLVASDEATAAALVAALAEPGFLRLDLPAAGLPLAGRLVAAGLCRVGVVQAMTTGRWPSPAGFARLMALGSQALG